VWALGCVLFELLSGEQAFPVKEHDTEAKFYGRIQRGEYDFTRYCRHIYLWSFYYNTIPLIINGNENRPVWSSVSDEAKDLVRKMLIVDPAKRWSASECLKHPWITGEAHNETHMQHMEESQMAHKTRLEAKKAKAEAAARKT